MTPKPKISKSDSISCCLLILPAGKSLENDQKRKFQNLPAFPAVY